MTQRISLDQIRSEATALEIDMAIVDGFLCLSKRGDPSCFYDSAVQINNPQALLGAWQWLQHYRANVQQIDEIRAQIANRQVNQIGGQVALVQARARLKRRSVVGKISLKNYALIVAYVIIEPGLVGWVFGWIIAQLTHNIVVAVVVGLLAFVSWSVGALRRRRTMKKQS